MRQDDGHLGKVDRHVVEIHRVGIFEPHAHAARHARTDAGLAGVEERDRAFLGDRLVERIGPAFVGKEALHGGMELEALDAMLAHQAPRLARAGLALGRIDRGERDHDVAVGGGDLGHFLVLVAAEAGLALGIDGEDHAGDLAVAIILGRLLDGRQHAVGAGRVPEIFGHGGLELQIAVIAMTAAGLLGMGVDVDGDDVVEIDHGFRFLRVAAGNGQPAILRHRRAVGRTRRHPAWTAPHGRSGALRRQGVDPVAALARQPQDDRTPVIEGIWRSTSPAVPVLRTSLVMFGHLIFSRSARTPWRMPGLLRDGQKHGEFADPHLVGSISANSRSNAVNCAMRSVKPAERSRSPSDDRMV
jgi:hypothetical protein